MHSTSLCGQSSYRILLGFSCWVDPIGNGNKTILSNAKEFFGKSLGSKKVREISHEL